MYVYDVKSGFTSYAINSGANIRFKLFAFKYNQPVEVVVPRKHDFRMKMLNITTNFKPVICSDIGYRVEDWIGQ